MKAPQFPPASCGSCGIHSCELNAETKLCRVPLAQEAWFVDEVWPEFDAYLSRRDASRARLFAPWKDFLLPIDSYRWNCASRLPVVAARILTLRRSLAMRSGRLRGGKRQAILENFDRQYAAAFSRRISYNTGQLVVWQNFLPFLAHDKTLGGREYDVLLWRAPRHILEKTLDLAAKHYPQSPTLGDFRSAPDLAEAEWKALERARQIVTPHRQLAELYPHKTVVLDWVWPSTTEARVPGTRIAFGGPTVARRGAYLVRSAMKRLGLPLLVLGRNVEQDDFWESVDTEERALGPDCLDEVGLLISPALTDFKPRLLMRALRSGIRVIATKACGLPEMENLHFVDPFDENELVEVIDRKSVV